MHEPLVETLIILYCINLIPELGGVEMAELETQFPLSHLFFSLNPFSLFSLVFPYEMDGNSTVRKFPFGFCRGIFACNDSPGMPTYNAKQPTGLALQLVLCSSVGLICFFLFCYLRVR